MTVPFAKIPANLRLPLFYAEVNNSQANTSGFNQRALIIGQKLAAGAATVNVPVISAGPGDGAVKGGLGSMLDLMAQAYYANDTFGEVHFLPLADDGAAVAASGSILFAGTTTAAGVYSLYIAGMLTSIAVAAGTTAANVAVAVNAAINANTALPVTSTIDTATVTITARNGGAAGNDIDIRFNYRGVAGGEALPAGVTAAITAMSAGATNPVLTTALANLNSKAFDFIVLPYTDTTSLAALTALLNDTAGRWSWSTQVYGHCFVAYRGTFGSQTTFGAARNDQHMSVMGFYDSPSPNFCWAAAYAAAAAGALRADPAAPLQTVGIAGVLAPPIQSRYSLSQRNSLLFSGISTFTVQSGAIAIENVITTYQLNGFGQPDNSYLEIETMFTLMAVLRAMAAGVTSKFARTKLAADGTRFAPGSNVTTPNQIRAYLISVYRGLENQGLVQSTDFFAANLVVQQNATNPNRVDVLWPGVLIDQLRIFALLAQFRLVAPTGGAAGTASAALV